jgi:hypothetical protein
MSELNGDGPQPCHPLVTPFSGDVALILLRFSLLNLVNLTIFGLIERELKDMEKVPILLHEPFIWPYLNKEVTNLGRQYAIGKP